MQLFPGSIRSGLLSIEAKNSFEQLGLDVELSPYFSGGAMAPALAAGEVDIPGFSLNGVHLPLNGFAGWP